VHGADGEVVRGLPGSSGRVTATARIVRSEADFDRLAVGDVLVCRLTTPAWTVLYARAAAIVTDLGSPLSHAAIVAREHAIPAVVGTHIATTTITDGQIVTVDGTTGVVTLPEAAHPTPLPDHAPTATTHVHHPRTASPRTAPHPKTRRAP
jgi:rifampicin phosphotransferase